MPIRIVLADDHLIVRQGLRSVLEREGYQICGEGANGHEAIDLAEKHKPDVAVLDFAMPLLNGMEACREIQRVSPRTVTILLTMHTEDQYVLSALQAGVKGFLVKTQPMADLIRANPGCPPGRSLPQPPDLARGGAGLSGQVRLAAQTPSAPANARSSSSSPRESRPRKRPTPRHQLQDRRVPSGPGLMEKLDLHETASIVRYAIRQGIVQA
jgi:DNA-binding NarL/FixJ family response regulator